MLKSNDAHCSAEILSTHMSYAKFGAPLTDIAPKDFTDPDMVYQIGVEPNRIDILMSIGQVDFDSAFSSKVMSSYDKIPIPIIGKPALIKSKKSIGGMQDKIDVERLEQDGN